MKSVFVTGTTSGIGLYTARHMHRLGWQVFAGVYPGEDTSKLMDGITDDARLHLVDIDITNAEMVAAAQAKIAQHTDNLHGLVNNAGISVSGPFEVLPLNDIRRQMEVNYIGQIAVTQAMMPMIRGATGRIVNVASILGRIVAPFSGPYCASKFALEAFTDALRMELEPWGIHVVAIEPTNIATDIWEKEYEWQEVMREELPPGAKDLYSEALEILNKTTREQAALGVTPQVIADAIGDALTATVPKTRYTVGPSAGLYNMLWRFLPDRMRDRILLRQINMG